MNHQRMHFNVKEMLYIFQTNQTNTTKYYTAYFAYHTKIPAMLFAAVIAEHTDRLSNKQTETKNFTRLDKKPQLAFRQLWVDKNLLRK